MNLTLATALRVTTLFFFFSSAGALTCVLQGLIYLIIRPFSKNLGRRMIRFVSQIFLLSPSLLLEQWSSVRIITYGTKLSPQCSVLCLMQHACDTDSLLGLAWLGRFGYPYPGNAKCIVKKSLGKVPVFGWILRQAEFIFISRDWRTDEKFFLNDLESIKEYPKPFWIVLYPEGSRFTEEKKKSCQDFCLAKGYPIVNHVLFPRFKAFIAVLSKLRYTFDGIVDVTLMFEGNPPTVNTMLAGTADCTMHAFIRYFPIKNIPTDQKGMEQWLIRRWVEKDQILSKYKISKESIGEPVDEMTKRPSLIKVYVLLAMSCVVDLGILSVALTSETAFKVLMIFSVASVLVIGIFVALVLRPSSKGSGKNKKLLKGS